VTWLLLCDITRGLSALLAIPVLVMSSRGWLRFRRDQGLRNGICAIGFLAGVSQGSYQIRYLLDDVQGAPASAQLFLSMTLSIGVLVVVLLLFVRMRSYPNGTMTRLEENIDVALAIADLRQLRPELAEALANEARRLTAQAMLENARDD
jgi:hypothetical protein